MLARTALMLFALGLTRQPGSSATRRAFTALMQHLRDTDAQEHTVLMVQVENEVGMSRRATTARGRMPLSPRRYRPD